MSCVLFQSILFFLFFFSLLVVRVAFVLGRAVYVCAPAQFETECAIFNALWEPYLNPACAAWSHILCQSSHCQVISSTILFQQRLHSQQLHTMLRPQGKHLNSHLFNGLQFRLLVFYRTHKTHFPLLQRKSEMATPAQLSTHRIL